MTTDAPVEAFLPTDTAYKAATFIETYTGRAFWPLDPKVESLSVIDIAHALSNQCRYSGHVSYFYSTAQHCCLLAKHVADKGGSALDCLQILMHDAPEAYLVDIPRPVKQYMPEYRRWDHVIDVVIREWLGMKDIPRPSFIDDLDSRIIVDERAALMSDSGNDWGHRLEPVGVKIELWTPQQAEQAFLMQYAAYARAVYGCHQYLNYDWGLPVNIAYDTHGDSDGNGLDLTEVDIRGRVGRVRVHDDSGIMVRDPRSGMPLPKFKWWHGDFAVQERTQ